MLAASASAAVTIIASGDGNGVGNQVLAAGITNSGFVGNNGTNNLGFVNAGPTYNIAPHIAWANIGPVGNLPVPGWVSVDTNQDLELKGNGTYNGGYVDFFHTFFLSGPTVTASTLLVYGDDRVHVFVNGNQLNSNLSVPGSACDANPVGCVSSTQGRYGYGAGDNLTNPTSFFNGNANNIIQFRVFQDAGTGFGLQYLATITTVPEPGFYGLLSVGVGALLFRARRRSV